MTGKWSKLKQKKIASPQISQGQHVQVPTGTDKPADQSPPVFSLEYMNSGKYGLHACNQRERADFAVALYRRSQLTWNDIKCAQRHGLGFETLPRNAVRASVPKHVTPDVKIIAFRFSDKRPMVGYRQRRTFYVLWLDRDFTLYNHGG